MVVHVTIFFFLICISGVLSEIDIEGDEYQKLPKIYHIDSYDKCLLERKTFCRVSLKLTPLSPTSPSKAWNLIKELKKSRWHYNHDELYHAICVEDYYQNSNKTADPSTIISEYYANKYYNLGLTTTVLSMDCNEVFYETGFFDILFLVGVISYFLLIVFATIYDVTNDKKNRKNLVLFSIRHNIVKFKNKYQESNFEKFRCIEGLRFYTSLLIIFGHTYCSLIVGYVSNTEYFETFPQNYIKRIFMNLFVFLVQTFFLISAWLLSYRSFKIFSKSDSINGFKYIGLTFWNRYLRIIPPILAMVSMNSSKWIYGFFDGPLRKMYSDAEYLRCRKNWWTNFLFLNNLYYKQENMCYFISWYLSADIQLYLLTLILVIVIYRFQKNTNIIIGACILAGITVSSTILYIYNVDFIFRVTPENSKNIFDLFEFFATYTSPFTNMATYMLGLMFGYIYFKYENEPIPINHCLTRFWWTLFFGLPILVIIIPCYECKSKIISAILGGFLKPVYALGVGIGIFMMSKQKEGLLKRFFESKPVFFLGNITYTTYLSQFAIVFSRAAQASQPRYVSDFILFTFSVRDVVLSFICGFFVHLLLEMPMLQLQELHIPKFQASDKKLKIDQKSCQ